MPIVRAGEVSESEMFEGVRVRILAGRERGARSSTLGIARLGPKKRIPSHIHPDHEEVILILKGKLLFRMSGEEAEVSPGDAIIVPPRAPHELVNLGDEEAEIVISFPTIEVKREEA